MPTLVTGLLSVIGSTLMGMLVKAISADMIKFSVIKLLELGVRKYNEKAAKSPENGDDAVAKMLDEGLQKLKEIWAKA